MESKKIDKEKVLKHLLKAWQDISFVDQNLIKNAVLKAENSEKITKNIAAEVDFMMRVNQEVYYQISQEINNDNLLLEIEMIDKLSFIPKITAKLLKLPYTEERKKIGEDALIKALESYDGTISFKKYAAMILKKAYCPDKGKPKLSDPIIENEKKLTIEECIKEFSNIKEPENKDNHEIDRLFKDYKLDKNIDLEDQNYTKFITLKFGYVNERFYSKEEISQILKTNQQEINKYYLITLDYMKNYFNQIIDNSKKCIKK